MTLFALVLSMLILSGFFSGLEIAFLSVNKLRVELKSNQGRHWAILCSAHLRNPSKFISTILIGNNIALVVYGVTMEEIFRPYFEADPFNFVPFGALVGATVISTIIVLITAEFLPKALFRLNPSGILSILIYPFQFFYYLLWPFVAFVIWLSQWIMRKVLKTDFEESDPEFTRIDLDHFISQSAQHAVKDEENEVDTEILKNALEFSNVKVRDCLVPRTDIVAVDVKASIDELVQLFVESQHSKMPVFEGNIDQIIGYVHHLDLQKKPTDIRSILIDILIANEAKPANDMLNELTKTQKSMALVVDEYGGTAGIITIEDIMEEIFGEIEDEHDFEDDGIQEVNGDFIISAKAEVDLINERYDLNIPEGDYESIGGYIVSNLEDIPDKDQVFVIDNFEIRILDVSETKINRIQLTILD
jgi:CBS domain containing-hemolysin-like protein